MVQFDEGPDRRDRLVGRDEEVERAGVAGLAAAEAAADADVETPHLLAVDELVGRFEPDVVDRVLGAALSTARDGDVELPGHVTEVVVAPDLRLNLVQQFAALDVLVGLPGDRTPRDVAHRVTPRRARGDADRLQFLPYLGDVLQLEPVELDRLAGREIHPRRPELGVLDGAGRVVASDLADGP